MSTVEHDLRVMGRREPNPWDDWLPFRDERGNWSGGCEIQTLRACERWRGGPAPRKQHSLIPGNPRGHSLSHGVHKIDVFSIFAEDAVGINVVRLLVLPS